MQSAAAEAAYFRHRAMEERVRAAAASDDAARDVHFQLACLYETRLKQPAADDCR